MKDYKTKKYSVAETTKVQREKVTNDALNISMLDTKKPTNETMKLVSSYIDGKKEISDILNATIDRYKSANI